MDYNTSQNRNSKLLVFDLVWVFPEARPETQIWVSEGYVGSVRYTGRAVGEVERGRWVAKKAKARYQASYHCGQLWLNRTGKLWEKGQSNHLRIIAARGWGAGVLIQVLKAIASVCSQHVWIAQDFCTLPAHGEHRFLYLFIFFSRPRKRVLRRARVQIWTMGRSQLGMQSDMMG